MTTGATTGDWLVLFCEKERFKKRCEDIEPHWNKLAGELYGKTSVAYVNV